MNWWKIMLVILGIIFVFFMVGCEKEEEENDEENEEEEEEEEEEPEPIPDPTGYKWPQIDDTTQRWTDYCAYMQKITTDTLVALEMRFYRWVSDWDLWNKVDHWALPDVVWKNKKDDCDGLARLSADMLGRFVKILGVKWMEYYGYYRKYNDNGTYKIVASGHAIVVYKKNDKLLVFSNTSWWNNNNFPDYVSIGEMFFPEGIYLIRCRHWESGNLQWVEKAKSGEILEGTNIFNRDINKVKGYGRR